MNWNIKGCNKNCFKCQREFSDGDAFHCKLLVDIEGPKREDYCLVCWDNMQKSADTAEYSYWQGKYKMEPLKPVEERIEEPFLKRLLKKWINSGERLHKCFCYILALMLERSKTFRIQPSVTDPNGKKQLVYEDKENGETYILEDPGLTLKELDEIENDLKQMMKQELEIPK